MSTKASRMFLLQYGAERVPRSLSLLNGSAARVLSDTLPDDL